MSSGFVAPGYEAVKEAFDSAQLKDEGGAQLCIYRDNVVVVDLWAGQDIANDRPYTEDTPTVLMSCTKGVVAVLANMMVERGLLDLEAPVATYWPEFAQCGKDQIKVVHCLTHTAGLPAFPSNIHSVDLSDWTKCVDALAAAEPLWPAGEHVSYHALTYGHLVGELLRRVTGKRVGRLLADEIAEPLGLDLWIGLPDNKQTCVAPHIIRGPAPRMRDYYTGLGGDLDHPIMVGMLSGADATADGVETFNTPASRSAEIPAANAIGNARSLARMYASCIGEIDGVRLLRAETVERARQSRTKTLPPLPPLAKVPQPPGEGFGLGFALSAPSSPMLGLGSFGHAGAGGRLGFAHPERRVAVGYACNSMLPSEASGDPRWTWLPRLNEIVCKS